MKSMLLCLCLVPLIACGKKNDKPAESGSAAAPSATAAPSTPSTPSTPGAANTPGEGCTTYAQLTVKCANGVGEPQLIAATCQKTLERNNAMTPTMKVEVDCAGKANGDCDAFQKCIATTR